MRRFLLVVFLTSAFFSTAQNFKNLDNYKPSEAYDNIHVQKIADDELQSCFIIWIKKGVKSHYHAEHSENIIVLEGEAVMTMGDELFMIKKGDHINVPKGTVHAVTQILSDTPLKVLSIQSPNFDGSDRVFVDVEK